MGDRVRRGLDLGARDKHWTNRRECSKCWTQNSRKWPDEGSEKHQSANTRYESLTSMKLASANQQSHT